MSQTAEKNPAHDKAARKKRNILLALAGITLLTWGRTVFGGSGKPDPYELQKQYENGASGGAAVGAPQTSGGGATAKGHGLISTYEQAIERMRTWPEALDRKFIEGPVHVLTPINEGLEAGAGAEEPAQKPGEVVNLAPSSTEFGDLGLRLTSTALFGQDRWAIVNGVRVREGEVLSLQVDGYAVRYVVESIRPRAIVLRDGETVHNLKITIGK